MADFEWHSTKAKANLAEHGVDFEVAKRVFRDPAAIRTKRGGGSSDLRATRSFLWRYRARRRCRTHHLGTQSEQAGRKSLLWSGGALNTANGMPSMRTAMSGCRPSGSPIGLASMQ